MHVKNDERGGDSLLFFISDTLISRGGERVPVLKYKTEKAFLKKSREYINSIKYIVPKMAGGVPVRNVLGKPIEVVEYATPPNTADWARYLGINKQTLTQAYKERYPDAYAEIKVEIEAYAVRELMTRERVDGIKFNLINNHGWKDSKRLGLEEDTTKAIAVTQEDNIPLEDKLARIEALKKGLDDG